MGNRNPYRISVDQKNSYLYWGEVMLPMPAMIVWIHAFYVKL